MATTRQKRTSQKTAAPPFLDTAKLNGTEVAIRVGKSATRALTFTGLSYVFNGTKLKSAQPRKYLGLIPALVGIAGETLLNPQHPGANILMGACEGMSTFGIFDASANMLFADKKADFGLAGIAGPSGSSSGEPDWAALALQQREADAMEAAIQASSGTSVPAPSGGDGSMEDALLAA